MLKKVATTNAPAAIGPYSQGIIAGNILFASGQIAINPASGEIKATDIVGQTQQVMKNIGAILAEAGTDYTKVIKTTCFLTDMNVRTPILQENHTDTCLRSPAADSGMNRSVSFRQKKEKGRTDHEEVYHHGKCRCYGCDRSGYHHREKEKVR